MSRNRKLTSASHLAIAMIAALGIFACSNASPAPEMALNQTVNVDPSEASPLLGNWDIALYFSPNVPPSSTQMVIEAVNDDGTLTGTFYGSVFEQGRYTPFEDEIRFTVVTSDGSGSYITSGSLGVNGMIQGQTLSMGRDFLMAWTGEAG